MLTPKSQNRDHPLYSHTHKKNKWINKIEQGKQYELKHFGNIINSPFNKMEVLLNGAQGQLSIQYNNSTQVCRISIHCK